MNTTAGPIGPVGELRLALTVADFDAAVAFYRDALGLPEEESWDHNGRGIVLGAGRATLELLSEEHAAYLDQVEVGRPVGGAFRIALQVADSEATAQTLERAGGTRVAPATVTPWGHRNARVADPGGVQLTLFSEPPPD
ncbi:MAG TPA: VOC family protein [Kribbellaceae bacterium]|jgi:predicted enzyme related to lactoylglutathione lyase